MRKFLLVLFLGYSFSALAQIETLPYKYTGVFSILDACANSNDGIMTYNGGEISLGDVKIRRRVAGGFYGGDSCKIYIVLMMDKNEKTENYSLRCDIPEEKIEHYINFGKKIAENESDVDKEIFFKMHEEGMCKKLNELPPENSEGCTDSKPLRGDFGDCYSCDEALGITNTNGVCEVVCNGLNGRPERIIYHFDCVLKTCPKEKPLRTEWGGCYSCDYDKPIDVEEDNCSVCENRVMKEGECVMRD